MYANPATNIVCLPFFTAEECDELLTALDAQPWRDARVASPVGPGVDHELRRCLLQEIRDRVLLQRLTDWLIETNNTYYQFEAWSFVDHDPVAAMRYEGGGHFDWHLDNATAEMQSRKLSFTIQLCDPASYDGGNLEFAMYHQDFGGAAGYASYREQIRQRGAITVFPAFHLHRVSPVTRGARTALVGWLHGPRFR